MNYWFPDDFGTHERMIFIRPRRSRLPLLSLLLALIVVLFAIGARMLEEEPAACRAPYAVAAPIGQIEYHWEIYDCNGGR